VSYCSATVIIALDWLRRVPQRRAVQLTDTGRTSLRTALGLQLDTSR